MRTNEEPFQNDKSILARINYVPKFKSILFGTKSTTMRYYFIILLITSAIFSFVACHHQNDKDKIEGAGSWVTEQRKKKIEFIQTRLQDLKSDTNQSIVALRKFLQHELDSLKKVN